MSRLSRRPRTVTTGKSKKARCVWFPSAAQVQKEVRPRSRRSQRRDCSGDPADTTHNEGVSMAQATRTFSGSHSRTGHPSVSTPRDQAIRATEPSRR